MISEGFHDLSTVNPPFALEWDYDKKNVWNFIGTSGKDNFFQTIYRTI